MLGNKKNIFAVISLGCCYRIFDNIEFASKCAESLKSSGIALVFVQAYVLESDFISGSVSPLILNSPE